MEDNKKNESFNEKELLEKVEDAARKGAGKGRFAGTLLQWIPLLAVIGVLVGVILPRINAMNLGVEELLKVEDPAETHDLVIENQGIFGYTAADFEEAILGDASQQKKLEVFKQEVSDATTITDAGLFKLGVFSKNQIITYNGEAIYTVDLGDLKASDINFDEEEKMITIKIPHAVREEINIPENKIQFGDTKKGMLAFGDIEMSPENASKVQAGARQKMEEKLDASDAQEMADRFAKLSVWEIYSPIVKGVAKDYSLEVVFR